MPRNEEYSADLYKRIRQILDTARSTAARSVNAAQVVANWMIGRGIVEQQQKGRVRADYGRGLIERLSAQLSKDYGRGYATRNLASFREFYVAYPQLLGILHAVRAKSQMLDVSVVLGKLQSAQNYKWRPGLLHPNLSWTHYRTLLRVESPSRSFYEIESVTRNWSARELERQITSLLYERLALSKDKKGVMRLSTMGQSILKPADVFKDPVVMEFLGLPPSAAVAEADLEKALLSDIQSFLLELGSGFAFVSRQERLTLDGDHFYVDLVFYHTVLKCFVLIDLKVGKMNHADVGQLQLYVNYFDLERRSPGDNPTLGLILCTDKNEAVVRYMLGDQRGRSIFASRYKLHLPSEADLRREIKREVRHLAVDRSSMKSL